MIKVAFVSHSAAFAGAEKMLFVLAELLRESDEYYPVVFLPENPEVHSFQEMCGKANIETETMPANLYYIYVNSQTASRIAGQTLEHAAALSQSFLEHGIDLVVCNTLTSLVPLLAARMAQIPSVLWVHGILDSFFIPASNDLEQRLLFDRASMYLSDEVICCSKWVQDYYEQLSTVPVCMIPNWSAEPEKSVAKRSEGKFVCLNTFDPNKGLSTLLKAAVILRKQGYEFEIDLYGSGPQEAALREFVQENGLSKIVTFCGRTNDVGSVYSGCRCLVQPSELESFGLTLTEAMSYGRPVIAVNSGGPKGIVADGETGFLVPPRDEKALAEKMAYILEHPEEAERFGERGRVRYEDQFSSGRARETFTALFRRVLENPRERDQKDQLLEDMLWSNLHLQAKGFGGAAVYAPNSKIRPVLPESQLCLSGPLRKRRRYMLETEEKSFSCISLLFAVHERHPVRGSLCVRVWQGKACLAEGSIDLMAIQSDVWTDIAFGACGTCCKGRIVVELEFRYSPGSARLEVYEYRDRRSFVYKVFNKLHMPLKGKDTLVAQL